jgi:hypothetical protein
VNRKITLHSLAELGSAFGLDDQAGDVAGETACPVTVASYVTGESVSGRGGEEASSSGDDENSPRETPSLTAADPPMPSESMVPPPAETGALEALLADLDGAVSDLAEASRRDEVALAAALAELEAYDRLVAAQRDAEAARARAARVLEDAEALASGAFSDDVRTAAAGVVERAARAAAQAAALVDARRADSDRLGERLDIQRLVAERSRREAAEVARTAADLRAQRLAEVEAGVRRALDEGQLEHAETLLTRGATDLSESGALSSLRETVAQQIRERRVVAADSALRLARYDYRRCPEEAIACLEALELDGLPADLSRQVFGEWAAACSRVCRRRGYAEPLRYAPLPGRGVVLARERPDADYVVLSALGMGPRWRPGATVAPRDIGGARPLR